MSDSPVEEEVFEVEEIQGHKFQKKNKEVIYYIKWLNYSTADNSWEKEANVYATDLIENYWNSNRPSLKDKRQFEKLNNSRKNPIKLAPLSATEKKIPTVISAESTSPQPSSPTPKVTDKAESSATSNAATNPKQQQTLDNVFGVHKGKGKQKEIDQPAIRLPQVIATNNNEDDDMDDDILEETMEIDSSDDDAYVTPARSTADQSEDDDMSVKEKVEKKAAPKKTIAATSKGQDYFLEQHEKKRKREELGFDDDSSIEGMSPSPKSKKTMIEVEEIQDDEDVIFNEKYAIDPPLDWSIQAERVEYIGKELDQSDLYCLVKWKDGVKSIHPLSLVKEKRPDLVIDRFVQMVIQQ